MNDKIVIHGAREHNLKNIDLEIPRDKLIVFMQMVSAAIWRAFPPMRASFWG